MFRHFLCKLIFTILWCIWCKSVRVWTKIGLKLWNRCTHRTQRSKLLENEILQMKPSNWDELRVLFFTESKSCCKFNEPVFFLTNVRTMNVINSLLLLKFSLQNEWKGLNVALIYNNKVTMNYKLWTIKLFIIEIYS